MAARPNLVVVIGVIFTSFSSIFVRLSTAPPLIIASYRMWLTTIFVVLLFTRDLVRPGRETSDATGSSRPPVVLLSIASGVFLSLHFAAWITSLQFTSVASSTVLVTTHPIIVAVAGYFFLRERMSWRGVALMLTALAGGLVLAIGGFGEGGSAPLGNLLAFAGAVAVSGYMLIGRVVRQHLSGTRYTLIVYSVSAALLTVYAIINRDPLFGYAVRELLIFLALAVVCTLLGHSLFNWALRYLSPAVISVSILGEPVIATILAVVIFREVPSVFTVAGGALILVSIYLFVREPGRRPRGELRAEAPR